MVFLAILTVFCLACANYLIGRRALFYPPVIFGLVWGLDLLLVWAARETFYPLDPRTLFVICIGYFVLSLGALLGMIYPSRSKQESISSVGTTRIMNIMVALSALGIPFCYWWISKLGAQYGGNFFAGARIALLDIDVEQLPGTVLFNAVVNFSTAVAILAFCERQQNKRRSTIALAITIVLNLMTGGRAGITVLAFSLVCIDWIRDRRLNWKPLLAVAVSFLTIFALIAVFVSKGDARPDASLKQNAGAVAEGFMVYAGCGIVAFDRVVRDPHVIPHNWQVDRIFRRIANMLGANFDIPILHAEYVDIGPNSLNTNVYTFYFAYIDWGYWGGAFLVLILGFLVTLWYKQAIYGNRVALAMYSTMAAGLMLTIYNELLFMNLAYLLRLYAIAWIAYRLPVFWHRLTNRLTRIVEADAHMSSGLERLADARDTQ